MEFHSGVKISFGLTVLIIFQNYNNNSEASRVPPNCLHLFYGIQQSGSIRNMLVPDCLGISTRNLHFLMNADNKTLSRFEEKLNAEIYKLDVDKVNNTKKPRSKRSSLVSLILPKITNIVIDELFKEMKSTNKLFRSKRSPMATVIISTLGRFSTLELTAAASASSAMTGSNKEKIKNIFDSAKIKIMEMLGVDTIKNTPNITTITELPKMMKIEKSPRQKPNFTLSTVKNKIKQLKVIRDVENAEYITISKNVSTMENENFLGLNRSRRFIPIPIIITTAAKIAAFSISSAVADKTLPLTEKAIEDFESRKNTSTMKNEYSLKLNRSRRSLPTHILAKKISFGAGELLSHTNATLTESVYEDLKSKKNTSIMKNGHGLKLNRSRRLLPIFVTVGKMVGMAGTIILAGTATSFIDSAIKEKYALEQEERLIRKSIDCRYNNYGCLNNFCWANCGPRLTSADWCVTTNGKIEANNTVQVARCMKDADCNNCWPCATSCKMEGVNDIISSGSAVQTS